MKHARKFTLKDIDGDLKIYFNWSLNALVPLRPGAADVYLKQNCPTIIRVAQRLLKQVNYVPGPIYRGIILRQSVDMVQPHEKMQYLSFSTELAVAEHFADVNGFGSGVVNVALQLGEYGYVIEYTPQITEVIFHYRFLSILPYAEALNGVGTDGQGQVAFLKAQKEIMILQPATPFTHIRRN